MPEFLAELNAQSIGTIVLAAVLVLIGITIFKKPLGCLLRLFVNTLGGFIALFVINNVAIWFNIPIGIGINWVNAIIIGIFGLPGLGFLLIWQLLLQV